MVTDHVLLMVKTLKSCTWELKAFPLQIEQPVSVLETTIHTSCLQNSGCCKGPEKMAVWLEVFMLGFNTFTEHSQEIIASSHNMLCGYDSDQLSRAEA